MAYGCELGNGQRLFLDCAGTQTLITLSTSSTGQQQQATQGIETGSWTAAPTVFRTADGIVVKLQTDQGERFIGIQGSSIGLLTSMPLLSNAPQMQMQQVASPTAMPSMAPMQPMQPMTPLQPLEMGDLKMGNMQMGNMQMSLQPMEMKMGNMSMQMGVSTAPPTPPNTRLFCSQCGVAVQPTDRFCSSCGHQLGT